MISGIVVKKGLSKEDIKSIGQLNDACNRVEKLNMKLNWDMLETRSKDIGDDFFYFVEDKIVGYLGMYGFGRDEIEITGMVHPDFRGKGIFNELFSCARLECAKRGIERILLICERKVASGSGFAKMLDSKYDFSEYKMERNNDYSEAPLRQGILLKAATEDNVEFLLNMDALAFGISTDEVKEHFGDEKIWNSTFIGEYEGTNIGKIRTVIEDGNGYIYGFGVLPSYRGKGYGREILGLGIKELLKLHPNKIMLEVACDNERALNLYKSCGFEISTIYDYYEVIPK